MRDQPWENRVYMSNLPFDLTREDIVSFLEAKVCTQQLYVFKVLLQSCADAQLFISVLFICAL